jgi:DNA polymerase I
LNYEARNGAAEIWLWGIDNTGKRVLIIDRDFLPYFYVLIEDNKDQAAIMKEIVDHNFPSIVRLEPVERKLFGKSVKCIRVYCNVPEAVPKYAKELREFEGIKDCIEDDVRFSVQYLIDNEVAPCGWHQVEAVEEKGYSDAQVDRVYLAKSHPRLIERPAMANLRILGFSTMCYSKEGSPKPDRNPVVMISAATSDGAERQFLAGKDQNDKPVLQSFVEFVHNFDPDIIVGYGANTQEWPYLIERCRKLGLHLYVDRTETEPHTSSFGHVSVTGRANIDLADYAEEFPEVKIKTLANLADYLGIMKLDNRVIIEDVDFAAYWDDRAKREALKRFSKENAQSIMGITSAVLDFAMQLSNLVCLPLDHVGTAAVGFRVESFLMKRAHKIDELIPKRIEQPYRPYAGAIVLTPKSGLHENIAALDFKSMYPNIMIRYNLSPDTYVKTEEPEPEGGTYETPEVKHRFRKEPSGFYKEVLSYLISARSDVRSKMKSLDPKSAEYRVLDARQKAVKVITNASYGYAGWIAARWYTKPVAEAATAWGRYTIMKAITMAEKRGLEVVYGDTDSIFVKNEPAKVAKLLAEIERELDLEISTDKAYTRIFFTEAKKRYAGLLTDGRLDIVGLEVMRGDWAAVARKVQEKVLEIVLREQSPQKAARFVQQFIGELRQKRVPYRDLVIWKTLTKPAEEYEIKAAHVEAARMLKGKGWELGIGDKVGYVVVAGSGRLYERVKPYVFASYAEVDLEYYVSKQIVPAAARVLESFEITEEQLLSSKTESKEGKRLTDFFSS